MKVGKESFASYLKLTETIIMRYNSETNRYRNVNAEALGRLLDMDTPINCCEHSSNGCMPRSTANHMHGMHMTQGAKLASSCSGEPSLAMVYPPYQHFRDLYSPYEALCRGTLFRELDKPWKVGGGR